MLKFFYSCCFLEQLNFEIWVWCSKIFAQMNPDFANGVIAHLSSWISGTHDWSWPTWFLLNMYFTSFCICVCICICISHHFVFVFVFVFVFDLLESARGEAGAPLPWDNCYWWYDLAASYNGTWGLNLRKCENNMSFWCSALCFAANKI